MSFKNPPFLLAETNLKSVQQQDYQLAVQPWGATEAHNYHLPYATDNYQVSHVAREAAKSAWEQGGRPLILPCIPYGINTGQLDVPFCMNIVPSTQLAILRDTCQVLLGHGIYKLVILNGHGGNNFKSMIRELSIDFPEMFVCWVNWFQAADWNQYFVEPGDHAGEMETSAIMHIRPDLVRPLHEAGPGISHPFRISALREGWVYAQRKWTEATEDTGVGNPKHASADKGARYLEACSTALADFFCELGETPLDALYEK